MKTTELAEKRKTKRINTLYIYIYIYMIKKRRQLDNNVKRIYRRGFAQNVRLCAGVCDKLFIETDTISFNLFPLNYPSICITYVRRCNSSDVECIPREVQL
jgi:hypothetical protein